MKKIKIELTEKEQEKLVEILAMRYESNAEWLEDYGEDNDFITKETKKEQSTMKRIVKKLGYRIKEEI